MEGMATNMRPSRPEITDVVNAVYDGADGLVLMQARKHGRTQSTHYMHARTHTHDMHTRTHAHALSAACTCDSGVISTHACVLLHERRSPRTLTRTHKPRRAADPQETSQGRFAALCVSTTSQIMSDAEAGASEYANYGFVRWGGGLFLLEGINICVFCWCRRCRG
jgi:hypothetical protein